MEEEFGAFERIKDNLEMLRRAVEERNYPVLERLLLEQRTLVNSRPISDPHVQMLVRKGSELLVWALTTIRSQRSGYAGELAAALNAKHLISQYEGGPAARKELISVDA
jgi:hypothetical protein